MFFCLTFFFAKNNFAVDNDSSKVNATDIIEPETFTRAILQPSFPGGIVEMKKFISKNLVYPKKARENGLEGKVVVKFYIDIDGSIKEPVVLKDGVGGGADVEAIKLVKKMPKWSPGIDRGKPVKVYYTLPLTFKLQ